MKKKRFLALILVIAVVFTMAGCSSNSSPATGTTGGEVEDLETALANMEPMELKMPTNIGSNHALQEGFVAWAERVNEVTKGKINITIYGSGSLLKPGSIYEGVRDGVGEIGQEDLAYNAAQFPLFSAFFMGGLSFPDVNKASLAANEWIQADFEEYKDVKMLWSFSMPPSVIMGNKKIESLEDLNGTQVRVTGFCVDTISRLGGTAVGLTMSETYDALLKGTVDVNLSNPGALGPPLNLAEVSDYITLCPGISYIPHAIFMNLDVWNSIPPAVQAAIEDLSVGAAEYQAEVNQRYYDAGLEAAEKENIEVIELSDTELQRWYDVLSDQHDDWIDEKNKAGLDGQGAYDHLMELIDKYSS